MPLVTDALASTQHTHSDLTAVAARLASVFLVRQLPTKGEAAAREQPVTCADDANIERARVCVFTVSFQRQPASQPLSVMRALAKQFCLPAHTRTIVYTRLARRRRLSGSLPFARSTLKAVSRSYLSVSRARARPGIKVAFGTPAEAGVGSQS